MALSPQWLDELRARVTLSSVVMRTTKLQKAGREWKACCPFHDEKTPSFYVNDAKGFYHCFGCQAHGDVIRWMTDQRGLPFIDAVKELASEAGMELPAPDPKMAERAERRATLHDVTAAAQDWFVDRLHSSNGAAARDYLKARGVSEELAQAFGFGFAPDARQALSGALPSIDAAMLIDSGLRITVDGKEPYDRFRGRLMLPIRDMRGRVVGFGGRILDTEAQPNAPKYLNSPDTPLFDKGRLLFNLDRAAPASRKADRILVVEGYMDVVALAAAGIDEAVAPMGTALTETQIELLWRHVPCPVLCFDGDAAGQRASMKAIVRALPLLRPSHSLSIVQLPSGMDPDDLVKAKGRKGFDAILETRMSLVDAIWKFESRAEALDTPEAKAGLKARLLELVDTIAHPDVRSLYRRDLLNRFSEFAYPKRSENNYRQAGSSARPRLSNASKAVLAKSAQTDHLARAVMAGLYRFPTVAAERSELVWQWARLEQSVRPSVERLMEHVESLDSGDATPIFRDEGQPTPADNARFSFLSESADPQAAEQELVEALSLLVERPALSAALDAATQRFASDPENAFIEQQRLLQRKLAFERRLGQIGSRKAAIAATFVSKRDGSSMGSATSKVD